MGQLLVPSFCSMAPVIVRLYDQTVICKNKTMDVQSRYKEHKDLRLTEI